MERRLTAVALLLPLVLAAPAMAQAPGDDRSDISNTLLGPSYVPAGQQASALPSLADQHRGFSVTAPSYAQESGPRVFSNKLVGAWPIAKYVHVGVGLMSVSRYSRGEAGFRPPMKDVEGRRQRIAAVGFSFSF